MTTFDILALSAIFISIIWSAMRGLVGEIVAFGSWIAALIMARMFAGSVSDFIFSSMNPRPLAVICSFVAIYILARLAIVMLLQLMKVVLKKTHLSELDRILGAVLGAIKGVIAVSLAVLACSFSDLPKQDDWKHAVTAPMFESLAMLAKPYLPKFLADQVSFEHEKSTQPSNDKIPQSKSQSNISNSLFYPQNIKATVPLPFWGSRGVGFYSAVRDVQMATKNVFSSSI